MKIIHAKKCLLFKGGTEIGTRIWKRYSKSDIRQHVQIETSPFFSVDKAAQPGQDY